MYTGKFKRPRLAEVWGRCIYVCGLGPWQGASPSVSQAYRGVRRGPGPGLGGWGRIGYAALPGTVVILRISWSYHKQLPFCRLKLKRQPTPTNSRPRGGARYPHHSGQYPGQQGVIICSSPYTALAQVHGRLSSNIFPTGSYSSWPLPGLQGHTEGSRAPAFLVTIFVRRARPARRAGRQTLFLISSHHCTRRLHRYSLAWTLTRVGVRSW